MAGMRALAAVLFGGLCGMAVAATVQGQADVVELEQAEPPTIQASAGAMTVSLYVCVLLSSPFLQLT